MIQGDPSPLSPYFDGPPDTAAVRPPGEPYFLLFLICCILLGSSICPSSLVIAWVPVLWSYLVWLGVSLLQLTGCRKLLESCIGWMQVVYWLTALMLLVSSWFLSFFSPHITDDLGPSPLLLHLVFQSWWSLVASLQRSPLLPFLTIYTFTYLLIWIAAFNSWHTLVNEPPRSTSAIGLSMHSSSSSTYSTIKRS